jgi:enoyl-CoA hydratase
MSDYSKKARGNMSNEIPPWPLSRQPSITHHLPGKMQAMTLWRDQYGPPSDVLNIEEVNTPVLTERDSHRVLVSVLATGPNFNTNFAALGLPVPVFGRGDSAILHIPGSDALGIVVDAGAAVENVRVGQAVILDSWTGASIRGYESHDGFNAQFVKIEQERALPVPESLGHHSPEQLAAMLLTYGTAYRCIVERLAVEPGDSVLVMGGGKGTSFAGAQIAKALGARIVLMGSNEELGQALIQRGIADAFVNRSKIPRSCYGVIGAEEAYEDWMKRTEPFREAVLAANHGEPVDKVFEHTGGLNFPLLTSVISPGGSLSFFGATGGGLKGEYKESFYYDQKRYVLDARWVWMRQKLLVCSDQSAADIFNEISLLPGQRGLIWGADDYAVEFAAAAMDRQAELVFFASHSNESDGISRLVEMGIHPFNIIDRDSFNLLPDMPDPLTESGTPNDAYHNDFMLPARAMGKAIWNRFGPRTSPDFIVERPDQSTLHYSTFLLRDHDEKNEMPSGYVLMRGQSKLGIFGSHMYRSSQAAETIRLLAEHRLVMEQEDLDVVSLQQLPEMQQKMLDGSMTKPKGVALVQATGAGTSIIDYEEAFLGKRVLRADPEAGRFIDVSISDEIAVLTLNRPSALNALSEELVLQLGEVVGEIEANGTIGKEKISSLIIRGAGRSFVAGADIEVFIGKSPEQIEKLALDNMAVFSALENLSVPVISLVDGFALGGGNELAMSTHYRIVTENAQLGQPEVKLGLIPGYGGMQRLPRLIGPGKALEMSLNGEPVGAEEAVEIGLAHEFHGSATALKRAFEIAMEFVNGDRELEHADWDKMAEGLMPELHHVMAEEKIRILASSPAPDASNLGDVKCARSFAARFAIEALRAGFENGFASGINSDARFFGEVVTSPSGQEWSQRFLDKDPLQSSYLLLLERG